MRQYKYNISCSKPCHVAWSGEQNGTILTFEGYKMDNEENALYLVLDGYANIPLADYSLLINQPLSTSPTTFRACLMEVSNDGETVFKSNPFTLKVEKSADASADYEVVDERLELVYLKHNALYQESKSYYEDIQRRVEAGEFNGKDGNDGNDGVTPIKGVDYFDGKDGYTPVKGKDYFDGEDGKDYQITPSDYEAIAERTKDLVPPYDDSKIKQEIKQEINRVNESITELSKSVLIKVGNESEPYTQTLTDDKLIYEIGKNEGKSLDDVAVSNVTYRDLFEGSYNLISFMNFDSGSYAPAWKNAGEPIISNEKCVTSPYSLKAFGTTSCQLRAPSITTQIGHNYYCACFVNVTRYVKGYTGILVGGNYQSAYIQRVTDGFELASNLFEEPTGFQDAPFIGTWSSANADCYVDNPVYIDVTGLNVTQSDMDSLFREYVEIKNTAKETLKIALDYSHSDELLCGVVIDATSSDGRFTAMKELYDIGFRVLKEPNYKPNNSDMTNADKGIVCILPKHNTSMYRNAPLNILYAKNENVQSAPASTTKVMATITGLDYISNIKDTVTLDSNDRQSGSGDFFYSGDVLTYEDLIYGMMLPSSNTCAMTFAHNIGKKILGNASASFNDCITAFVSAMNKKAQSLGMTNTLFDTPSGLSRTNKTTASDMLKVVVDACSYDALLRVWNVKQYDVIVGGSNPRTVTLDTTVTNATLERKYHIYGGKTGSLDYGDLVARALVMVGGMA